MSLARIGYRGTHHDLSRKTFSSPKHLKKFVNGIRVTEIILFHGKSFSVFITGVIPNVGYIHHGAPSRGAASPEERLLYGGR